MMDLPAINFLARAHRVYKAMNVYSVFEESVLCPRWLPFSSGVGSWILHSWKWPCWRSDALGSHFCAALMFPSSPFYCPSAEKSELQEWLQPFIITGPAFTFFWVHSKKKGRDWSLTFSLRAPEMCQRCFSTKTERNGGQRVSLWIPEYFHMILAPF